MAFIVTKFRRELVRRPSAHHQNKILRSSGYVCSLSSSLPVAYRASKGMMHSGAPIEFVMDVNPFLLQWTFTGLEERRWWFRGTVIDTNGRESFMAAAGINHISNTECIPN